MSDIKVTLGSEQQPDESGLESDLNVPEKPEHREELFSVNLKARRTLDGSILITDHPDIDIVIIPNKMKLITFPKETFDDTIYDTQNRLFKYLFKKGVLVYESVAASNVYGSMECKIQKPKQEVIVDDLMIMIVSKFIEQEKPSYKYEKSLEDQRTEDLTEPDDAKSTELGDVPAATEKGSVPIHQVRRYAYGL